ncbi:hypothetical protein HHK36_031375 (mitochondrion) [Tetracentron sinense]|uniref:ATP synthase protein MI25 n=1 Tax=Tetracentron sinense TaxID=13715 RepID=A0A835CYI4_TETSI|nr:hypothetical protein LWB77_mgp35 [Tetracentron sinense]KAF8364973.1 hypothetical protein HHK36_033069 [Tetracentron sinense]KAF8364978.1 hypothetical protein HHK36_033076 [Tetracentron sinense]KAF8376872.1 hypothetical protein HHK36_031375 [Tetracentron sinense]
MRLSSTDMQDRKMLFAAIPSICASSSKKISIYNEEMIVARRFIGFIILTRKSLGKTFKVTLDGRIQAIQEESQQFPNPNEVVPPESNEQQRLLRISLRICGTVVESLPTARCAPKCEKTVQALLCRNLNVKSATLPNATSSRRIRLQDDLVTGFHFSVSERFVPGCTLKASIVELIREGLVVLRMVRVGGQLSSGLGWGSIRNMIHERDFEIVSYLPTRSSAGSNAFPVEVQYICQSYGNQLDSPDLRPAFTSVFRDIKLAQPSQAKWRMMNRGSVLIFCLSWKLIDWVLRSVFFVSCGNWSLPSELGMRFGSALLVVLFRIIFFRRLARWLAKEDLPNRSSA